MTITKKEDGVEVKYPDGIGIVLKYPRGKKEKKIKGEIPLKRVPKSEFTSDGYLPSEKYLPNAFELVSLKKSATGSLVSGWWGSRGWQGLRVKENEKVSEWQFEREWEEGWR